jgi:hypothetical protein
MFDFFVNYSRYGFVTFQEKSSVRKVESMGIIYFKNKKINIGPAVKKEATVVQPELVLLTNPNVLPPQVCRKLNFACDFSIETATN